MQDFQQKEAKKDNAKTQKSKKVFAVILSVFVGIANGLFGGGGGMFVIPILTLLCGLDQKKAHSSAVLTILPLSIASSIVYLLRGDFPVKTGSFVAIGVVLGGVLGTFLMKKFSSNWLSILFYSIMIFAGIFTLCTKL